MTEATEKVILEQTENKSIEGTDNTNQNKERLFTQKELEEILSERLKRERKTTGALNDVKKLLKAAADKGLLEGNSYCEMAENFCRKLGGKQDNLPDLTPMAEENLKCTENQEETLLEEGALAADKAETLCEESEVDEKETPRKAENEVRDFAGTLGLLREKFKGEDIGYLLSTGLFESFAKGRQGKLVDVFSDFCEFMSHIGKNKKTAPIYYDEEEMADQEYDDDFSSTAFSSYASSGTSYEDGLTKQQMDIAKSAGMSYREYAQLLDAIPKNKTGKSYVY